MLAQILCNNKYSCPKSTTNESSFSDSESDTSDTKKPKPKNKEKKKKEKRRTNIKMEKKNEPEQSSDFCLIIDEPKFNQTSTLKTTKCDQPTCNLSPSFNIKPNMKSTPIHSCHNCKNVSSQSNVDLTTPQCKGSITSSPKCTRFEKAPHKKNVTDTVVDVHSQPNGNESDIEIDTSFKSF